MQKAGLVGCGSWLLAVSIFLIVLFFKSIMCNIPKISVLITKYLHGFSDKEDTLKQEIQQHKEQLKSINIVDEFAKHAKIQRKLNAAEQMLQPFKCARTNFHRTCQLVIEISVNALYFLLVPYLVYSYRNTPVVAVPYSWLFPFQRALSFPGDKGIGIVVWFLLVRFVIDKLALVLRNVSPSRNLPS